MANEKNKIFLLLVVGLMGLGVGYKAVFAASFSDVSENTKYYSAVEYLKTKGVVNGYSDGTFKPDSQINRAEALKIIMLAIGQDLKSTFKINFKDVSTKDWFYSYVQKAAELNIVQGYSDGTFKPANNINIAESLKTILVSFKSPVSDTVSGNPYPDVTKDLWYAKFAQYSKTAQIFDPQDNGKLAADRQITRGDFAEIIYRLMYIKDNKLTSFPISTDWPTYTHPTNHYSVKVPFGWTQIDAGKQTIFWKQDIDNKQVSFDRIYPNSATVVIAYDANEDRLSLDDYVKRLIYDSSAVVQKVNLNGYPFENVTLNNQGIVDSYFYFPDKSILIIYSQVGDGSNKDFLNNEVRYLVGSIRYTDQTQAVVSDRDKFLSNVRVQILAKGQGSAVLKMFSDLVLISTDSIGIGTGPIDYYFSQNYNVTLKYERNSKTLLAISDGKTTAF